MARLLLELGTEAHRRQRQPKPEGSTAPMPGPKTNKAKTKAKTKHNVVVHLNDGSRRKGVADTFDPSRASFLLKEVDVAGNMVAVHDIDLQNVHAAFFVRDLALMRTSRHTYRDAPVTPPRLAPNGKRLRVTFTWGEVMDGMAYDYEPQAMGFYLYPMGPLNRAYNIEKVFVSRKATARVEMLSAE